MSILKIISKIAKSIAPPPTAEELFIQECEKLQLPVTQTQIELAVEIKTGSTPVYLRKNGSDSAIFKHIFWRQEYAGIQSAAVNNLIDVKYILDIGANIGIFSLYMQQYFPEAAYICVEPDSGNFMQLQKNIGDKKNIKMLQAAVWHKPTALKTTKSFRDGLDWSISMEETQETENSVKGYTIDQIISIASFPEISILKIDIEGAERFLFAKDSDTSFLKRTSIILIEIHDEFEIRETVYSQLRDHGFILYQNEQGLDIGIRKNLA